MADQSGEGRAGTARADLGAPMARATGRVAATANERLTTTVAAQNYDANNNAGEAADCEARPEPGDGFAHQRCLTTTTTTAAAAAAAAAAAGTDQSPRGASVAARRASSNLSESTSDGWHLLDADEERSSLSSGASCVSLASNAGTVTGPDQRHSERPHSGRCLASAGVAACTCRQGGAAAVRHTQAGNNKNRETSASRKLGNFEKSGTVSSSSSEKNKQTLGSAMQCANSKFLCVDDQAARERLNGALVHLCTGLYALLPLASLLTFAFLIYLLLFTKFWLVTVVYYSYLLLDSKTCNRGGRRWDLVYKSPFWAYVAAYFPVRLRYSREFRLSPSENYILNYHPHGISALGCVSAFATNGLNFVKLFPGIQARFMVHETSFLVPLMRETFGLRGDCSVNSASFDYILSKRWKHKQREQIGHKHSSGGSMDARAARDTTPVAGNLLALCGGGLAEADLSDMQTLRVVCATRKGFVKKALIHGAHLVPCLAFGENSVFKKVNLRPRSLLHKLESKWYQLFKFKHPIYYGTSLMFAAKRSGSAKLSRGVMPLKRPITVCMADPIPVERVEAPSQEQIDRLHSLYMQRLVTLYEDNRDLCEQYDCKIELL